MANHDLDDEINQLAVEIETAIAEGEAFLAELPEFEPRSMKARKMERVFNER